MSNLLVVQLSQISQSNIDKVGGKNASLGEMLTHLTTKGVRVPEGFALTVDAFAQFITDNQLTTLIANAMAQLNVHDITSLNQTGKLIRDAILSAQFSAELTQVINDNYQQLTEAHPHCSVAIRSSATAEDMPDASFAGQQDSFLNVSGITAVLNSIKAVYASLYNDRAIAYRATHGIQEDSLAISVAVQYMVRAETAVSGVMFTRDTESGFDGVVFITANYGLGDTIVKGLVNPDEFYVRKAKQGRNAVVIRRNLGSKHQKMIYQSADLEDTTTLVDVERAERMKFTLNDQELLELAEYAQIIEQHYGTAMDIEWAKDGDNDKIYIVQARPDTSQVKQNSASVERFLLKQQSAPILEGRSIGNKIGSGRVVIVRSIKEADKVQAGDVIVSDMTDPDWEPIIKRAAAIVTNRGGRTSHAAIIARELGIPAIVGTGNATEVLKAGSVVTVSCAEGNTGFVYDQVLDFEVQSNSLEAMPALPFKMQMNIGNPDRAFYFASIPNDGVGLARIEFMINRMIGIHPKALLHFDKLPREIQNSVLSRSAGYSTPVSFYVEKLSEGIATLATAFADKPVVVRMSDFKSNEYANLIGGKLYEPTEENPALGFRGASRYISQNFKDCFELECRAIKKVRDEMGMTNVQILIPFIRSIDEAQAVLDLMAENGLKRGENGLTILMMCELPVNILMADEFLALFDGFMIGTNDLTQLVLGLDRDSGIISHLFDEQNAAVKTMITMAIEAAKRANKFVGVSGVATAKNMDMLYWLKAQGVSALSISPDKMFDTWFNLANHH